MPLRLDKISILIVEDIIPMRRILVGVLEEFGVGKIFTADHGGDGFSQFQKHRPDIVITDWMMAPIDGLEMIKMIRTHPASPNRLVPVILISGYSALSRVTEARDMGVTEFLTKPFTGGDLAKRIAHIINKPRDFVEVGDFFGPDRRRRKSDQYDGHRRREEERDPHEKEKTPAFGDDPQDKTGSWDIVIQ